MGLITGQNCFGLSFFADSSDDSYVSAEEDPMEAPVFEFHLQDTVASSGADVILRCIIAGNPLPEGNKLYPVLFFFVFFVPTKNPIVLLYCAYISKNKRKLPFYPLCLSYLD